MKERNKNQIGSFFKGSSSSDVEVIEEVVASSSKAQSKIPYVIDDAVDAKILWCLLNMVKTRQSCWSCEPVTELFKRMFKTNLVLQKFKMKEDKARCYIMYQIFSSLHASVIENIQKARWYSVSFDKSFNHVREISQMSVNI